MTAFMKNIVTVGILVTICLGASGCTLLEQRYDGVELIPEAETEQASEVHSETGKRKLPAAYSLAEEKKLPAIRDQKDSALCWAFAALTALESSKSLTKDVRFSTEHLLEKNPFLENFESGGSHQISMAYLLSWIGPVAEVSEGFESEPSVHVQEIRLTEGQTFDKIKEYVWLYGGVETSLYVDFDEKTAESSYYNEENFTYCCPEKMKSNHEVVILGWDDNYPAENFSGEVQTNGAFLCQTSWGLHFGDQGRFYVSYEDANIGEHGVVYSRVEASDNYEMIFQSDLCGYTGQIGYGQESCSFANVYPAEESCNLRAAGFYATAPDTEYRIYVVTDFKDKSSFLAKEFVTLGYLEDAGFYTIDFPEEIAVESGKKFAVVIEIVTAGAEYPVAVESRAGEYAAKADLSDGEGYLSLQGMQWEHVEETSEFNICLKVYGDRKGE